MPLIPQLGQICSGSGASPVLTPGSRPPRQLRRGVGLASSASPVSSQVQGQSESSVWDTSFLAGFQGSVNQGQVTPHTATPPSLSSICKPQNIPDSTDAGISQLLTRSSQEAEILALRSHKRLVNLQHCTDTGGAQRGPNTSKKGLYFNTEERDQRCLVTCLKPQSKQEQGERTPKGHIQEERGTCPHSTRDSCKCGLKSPSGSLPCGETQALALFWFLLNQSRRGDLGSALVST